MRGFTTTTIVGTVTKDIELATAQKSGTSVASFSLAVNGRDDDVSFFDCVAWGKTAETISKYVHKGDPLLIAGSLNQRFWEGKDGVKRNKIEVQVNTFAFLPNAKSQDKEEIVDTIDDEPINLSEIPF